MDNFLQFLMGSNTELNAEYITKLFIFMIIIDGIVSICRSASNANKGV